MGRVWLRIAILLVVTHSALGSHFRGGSMSWKPVAGTNQIELKYQVSFTAKIDSNEGEECTNEKRANGVELTTKSVHKIQCAKCVDGEKDLRMKWICNDLNDVSAYGQYTMRYEIPSNTNIFEIKYEGCCWIKLEKPNGVPKVWKMLAYVDVSPRKDGRGINRSPVSASLPTEKFYKGCTYDLRIPASDPDNDVVRCRYADKFKGDCAEDSGACGKQTDGLTINPKNCVLHFDTSDISAGNHAVNVIIEDFIPPYKKKSKALSKVSLLFLLNVDEESVTCAKPKIISPPSCRTVRPGNTLEIVIVAEPGDPSKPIHKISTQILSDMTESAMENDPSDPTGNRKIKTLSWTPTTDHIGEPIPVCYSALDFDGYTSGQSCTFIYVDNDPLRPLLEASSPAPGTTIEVGDTWTIRFNGDIQQPSKKTSSATIRIIDTESNQDVYRINASDGSQVHFSGSKFTFRPEFTGLDTTNTVVQLELDEGVAIPVNGGCGSEAGSWLLVLESTSVVPTETPSNNPPLKCEEQTEMEISVSPSVEEGTQCFIHLPGTMTISGGVLPTSYELCCRKECSEYTPTAVPTEVETIPPDDNPPWKCEDENEMEISVPSSAEIGTECFIHLADTTTVSGGVLLTSYKLCCRHECREYYIDGSP